MFRARKSLNLRFLLPTSTLIYGTNVYDTQQNYEPQLQGQLAYNK